MAFRIDDPAAALAVGLVARLLDGGRTALELVDGGAPWAEVALTAGYYDQSHLINEFRSITGITPARYVTNLQDAAEVAA